MAITVTPNLTEINDCDAVTGWTGGTIVTDTVDMVEGTACLSSGADAELGSLHTYDYGSGIDMSATNTHVFIWMKVNGQVETQANGGYRIYLGTDVSNYSLFYVGGSDTHQPGWKCLCVDVNATRDSGAGTLNTSSIRYIGVQFYTVTNVKSVGRDPIGNCFWDIVRYGTGLTITSGASDGIGWADIYSQDLANAYGVITKSLTTGVYEVQGNLTFGDSSGTGSVDFDDTGEIVVFQTSDYFSSTFNQINVVGNGTGTTNFVMGDLVGGQGVGGCTLKSAGSKTASFTATDTDIDVLKIYGCIFDNLGTISLPAAATNREVITTTFTACGEVVADTCEIQYCNFVNADDDALVIDDNTAFDVTDCIFINCPDGIELITDTDDPWVFDNLMFYNCTYDVLNSTGSSTTVQNTNGSNASTYEGTAVTFVTSYTLTITVQDEDTDPIESVQTAIYTISGRTELMNEDTNSSGIATEAYTGSIPVDVEIRCRKASAGATKYVNYSTLGTISGDFNLLVTLKEDPNNNATS